MARTTVESAIPILLLSSNLYLHSSCAITHPSRPSQAAYSTTIPSATLPPSRIGVESINVAKAVSNPPAHQTHRNHIKSARSHILHDASPLIVRIVPCLLCTLERSGLTIPPSAYHALGLLKHLVTWGRPCLRRMVQVGIRRTWVRMPVRGLLLRVRISAVLTLPGQIVV